MSRILPILFNTEMVRAILDGRKTVTRRICKDGSDYCVPDMRFYDAEKRTYAIHNYSDKGNINQISLAERTCPICPSDILYVREIWCNANKEGVEKDYYYLADTRICEDYDKSEWKWRPSIHMPKEAARFWLKVKAVRVERLQEIDGYGVLAEGVDNRKSNPANRKRWENMQRMLFSELWDFTIKKEDADKYGWGANPWVWAIEFERCEKPDQKGEGKC